MNDKDNILDEEIIKDDLDMSNNNVEKKEDIKVKDVVIDIEFPLDDESKRKLQKKDLINVNEKYDVELTPHEENIPITSEVFEEEDFSENIDIAYPKDIVDEVKNKSIPLKKPIIVEDVQEEKTNNITVDDETPQEEEPILIEDDIVVEDDLSSNEQEDTEINNNPDDVIEKDTVSEDEQEGESVEKVDNDYSDAEVNQSSIIDLDEKIEDKEFISRHEIIFSDYKESKGISLYKPKKPKKEKTDEEIIKKKNNMAMMFMIILSTIVILGAYILSSNYEPPNTFKYTIPEEAMEMLTEEYLFITSIEEFLMEINQNVEKERILIDSYVSGSYKKEEIIKELNIILKTKENLKVLYDKIIPIEKEVIETKALSDKMFDNTIETTTTIISKINNDSPRIEIVKSFNEHVDLNNSNIYMYNQYVQSVFRKYNISVVIDGDKFILDTSWLKQD